KMRLASPDAARAALRELRAMRIGKVLETNIFFDTSDHRLLKNGPGVRLRRNRDVSTGREKFVLTYKGAVQSGELKSREEIEITVDRFDESITLLDRLG